MSKRTRAVAGFVAVGLLTAGCSSRDDEGTTASASPPATDAAPPTTSAPPATTGTAAPTTTATTVAVPAPDTMTEPTEPPAATEFGVTETEIHIGVIADVDTPGFPGLSQPLVDAVLAWGDAVNAAGGLAGRQVVVTAYDSKLNPDESANAVLEACQSEFALVGSGMFVNLNPAPLVECADTNGAPTGLPDLAALAISPGQGASTSTFAIALAGQDYTAAELTYNAPLYGTPYVEQQLAGATPRLISLDPGVPGIRELFVSTAQALVEQRGWEQVGVFPFPDSATQSEALPIINTIRSEGVNVVSGGTASIAKVMAEARIQGLDVDSIVWTCTTQCLTVPFAEANGEAANGLLASQPSAPYTDIEVSAIADYAQRVDPTQHSAHGVFSYAAGKAFEEYVAMIVAEHGINGLTRANLLEVIRSAPPITAGGILDAGSTLGAMSPCWVTSQLVDGTWVRVDPAEPGSFRCDESIPVQVVNPDL